MQIVIRVPYAVKKENHVKHLGVIFDRKINWRIHKEKLEAKIFKISQYISLSKVWKLSADIKLIRHEALITSIMTFRALPGNLREHPSFEIAAPPNSHNWQLLNGHTDPPIFT